MQSSPILFLFLPLRVVHNPDQTGLGRGTGSCGHLDGWMRPHPNSTTNLPFTKFRSSSFPLHAAHPCATVHLVHRSHLLAEVVGLCRCQAGKAVLACNHDVGSDQGTAVRMEESAVGFSCHASWFWLCWKNRALLFLSLFAQFLSLGLFWSCLSPSQHFCHSPSTSDFLLPLSSSPSLNNVLSNMATGLLLALSSLSRGEC